MVWLLVVFIASLLSFLAMPRLGRFLLCRFLRVTHLCTYIGRMYLHIKHTCIDICVYSSFPNCLCRPVARDDATSYACSQEDEHTPNLTNARFYPPWEASRFQPLPRMHLSTYARSLIIIARASQRRDLTSGFPVIATDLYLCASCRSSRTVAIQTC